MIWSHSLAPYWPHDFYQRAVPPRSPQLLPALGPDACRRRAVSPLATATLCRRIYSPHKFPPCLNADQRIARWLM
jgi:hypothetical protein